MCMTGLGDGIRLLTTYGLAFLSYIPAVSPGTTGSLLQTRKLMNILGVTFFIALPNISFPGSGLIFHIMCTLWSICHQSAIKIWFFYNVLTRLPTSDSSLELHFKQNCTIPPIPPLLTWQTRPKSNPRAVLRGWFGGQHWLKSHTGKKCPNSSLQEVRVQTENSEQCGKEV